MATPQWVLEKIKKVKKMGETSLNLFPTQKSAKLDEFPEEVCELINLEKLILRGNKISSIPSSVSKLSNLLELDISFNAINSLPSAIKKLKKLKVLDLRNNRLSSFPEVVLSLINLESLRLTNNKITDLPANIRQLKKIQYMYLGKNSLSTIPDEISQLSELRWLEVDHNKLNRLPENLFKLDELSHLDLSDNRFEYLPEFIAKFKKLERLSVTDNPIIIPPPEIAYRDLDAIKQYFRQLELGQDYLYEAKLLILGEPGAGKTSFANKIVDSGYVLREEKSTKGVDVLFWKFEFDNGKIFRVNLWDFGGQEIYHATHQFFLTKRSLYALVVDTRKEDTDFYYWLNIVELLSNNSPLLIVKNEKQDRLRELSEKQLRGQFDNIKSILATNLLNNRGLEPIRQDIKHYITQLPHIGSPLPKKWIQVRESLERSKKNYISVEEYFSVCKKNDIVSEEDCLQLSGYLHDIGVFLHFQDDSLLKKTIILKPKWGTDAVYKVLDNKKVIRDLGRFTHEDLEKIWSSKEYSKMLSELLQLMMKFKLCYEVPQQKNVYIAPQLLTENQPDYHWNDEDNLKLRYKYDFMPKGILLQFIVVMSESIWKQNVWKSGVVLEKEKTRSEIIEHYGKREIQIRVTGARKKEFMTIILHELDKIHKTYKRLRYDKLIPCNCVECKRKKEPYFYRLEILEKFVEDREDKIQCQVSYEMVNVFSLVDDLVIKRYSSVEYETPFIQNIYYGDHIDQGEKKMSKIKQTINNSSINGSVVAAENIKESFNVISNSSASDDLKNQLKQLAEAVDLMIKELPKEKAEEVSDDMKRLAEEAVKKKPNRKWYSVSIDGLIKAAENLDKLGKPVISLSRKILSILTAGTIE